MVHTFPADRSRPTDPLFFQLFGDIFHDQQQQPNGGDNGGTTISSRFPATASMPFMFGGGESQFSPPMLDSFSSNGNSPFGGGVPPQTGMVGQQQFAHNSQFAMSQLYNCGKATNNGGATARTAANPGANKTRIECRFSNLIQQQQRQQEQATVAQSPFWRQHNQPAGGGGGHFGLLSVGAIAPPASYRTTNLDGASSDDGSSMISFFGGSGNINSSS